MSFEPDSQEPSKSKQDGGRGEGCLFSWYGVRRFPSSRRTAWYGFPGDC